MTLFVKSSFLQPILGLFYLITAVIILLNPVSCLVEDKAGNTIGAYSEIYASIDYKERLCGHKPEAPLIIPDNPSEYGVRLCSLMIIREECPFHEYPVFCWELYTDIPGIGD
jgi:hypothetical protein